MPTEPICFLTYGIHQNMVPLFVPTFKSSISSISFLRHSTHSHPGPQGDGGGWRCVLEVFMGMDGSL